MRTVVSAILICMGLAACNTVEGVGRDVQDAGETLEKGAKKAKRAITY